MFSLLVGSLAAFVSTLHAGPMAKDMPGPPPCPIWYADREWNINLSGIYAFTDHVYPTVFNGIGNAVVAGGVSPADYDRYLGTDHAWGGGIDAKYFFNRYLGVGIEGFVLDVRQSYADVFFYTYDPTPPHHVLTAHSRQAVGGGLATFTIRYPIGCSRFAPYVWVGGGAIFGGGQVTQAYGIPTSGDYLFTTRSGAETKAMGQFGGGFEVRITPHIAWTNDFSWNVVDGRQNNFGMARTGISFAF